jgi:hypothetical protein
MCLLVMSVLTFVQGFELPTNSLISTSLHSLFLSRCNPPIHLYLSGVYELIISGTLGGLDEYFEYRMLTSSKNRLM